MSDGDRPRDDEDRDDEDHEKWRDERTLSPDEETLPGPLPGAPAAKSGPDGGLPERDERTVHADFAGDDVESTDDAEIPTSEMPTGEVVLERDDATLHAGFAETTDGTTDGQADGQADEDTLLELGREPETTEIENATDHGSGDSHTLREDEETLAGETPTQAPRRGAPATQADAFGGTEVPRAQSQTISDEGETIFEPGLTEAQSIDPNATVSDVAAGTAPVAGAVTDVDLQGASATARDAAADGFTERGGRGGRSSGPIRLAEGEPLGGRYTLVKRLGKGGMGEVWLAHHNLLEGLRAIKVIKASISRDKEFRARFLTEGQTMMSVKHPGVVEVTDLDQVRMSGELFMVMEHLDGRTLYDAIRDNEDPLCSDVREVVRIYKELAEGMQRIHDERIVHKDLKSDNALLVKGDDGLEHPKVIDFGLAKRMEDDDPDVKQTPGDVEGGYEPDLRTTLSGTLAYMAPEQFLGRASSFQSDIYAFGVMFQECFTKGEYPMPRGGLAHYLQMHAEGKKPTLLSDKGTGLDPYLTELSDRCMAVKKEDRPESFSDVAEDLQWWLDIPIRRERRNRLIGMAAVVLFLISTTIVTYFLAGDSVAVSQLQATVGGLRVDAHDGRVYLNADALTTLRFTAGIEGDPDGPSLEVGGEPMVAEIVHDADAGSLSVTADLSGLPDASHVVALLASSGAKPATLPVVIDRKAPGIRTLDVPGARDGFVSNESPDLRLVLDETTIASVKARVDGGETRNGLAQEASPETWIIGATSRGEGQLTKVEVEVIDFAGNRTTQRIEYTQDTTAPRPTVQDLRKDPDPTRKGQMLVPVRAGVGATLTIQNADSGRLVLTADGATQEKSHDVGSVSFDLPPISGDGYACMLVAEDIAGNATEIPFFVKQQADVARLVALDGASHAASVDGSADVQLSLRRFYGIASGAVGISAARTHGPDGEPVNEAASVVATRVGTGSLFAVEITIPAGELSEGTWKLTPMGQGEATPEAFTLTIDPTDPKIHSVSVMTRGGVKIPPDAWAQTRELVVEVDASDLDLESIALQGAGEPSPAPGRGRRTYRFDIAFAEDGGPFDRVLKLTDAAGNSFEQTINFKVDATNPVLTMTSPVSGQPGFDNKNPVDFMAVASEPDCTLHISSPEGIRGGTGGGRANIGSRDLVASVQMIQGDHSVEIWATDPAGRESSRLLVQLKIENLETKLPPLIPWPTGVTSTMRRVDAGDVVFENRIFPVSEGYIDEAEVTNAEYRVFLGVNNPGTGHANCHPDEPPAWDHTPSAETWNDPQWNADELPVVNVAYWDAYAFARWSGRRLPMEAEWVKAAAKNPGDLDLRRYPTGNAWSDGVLVTAEMTTGSAFEGPRTATASADVSPNKCLNFGGNVSEWVELDRVPDGEPDVAARGGNWYLSKVAAAIGTKAIRYPRSLRAATIGFRCAVDGDVVRKAGITGLKE